MHGTDPWAHTAPVYDGPPQYAQPRYAEPAHPEPEYGAPYGAPPGYGGPPTYPGHPGPPVYPGPPGYDEIADEPPNRRMGPLAITGMIAAILISLGLVFVLLSPTLSGKHTSSAGPNLPGVLNDPTGTPAPQLPAPEVQVPSESPPPTESAEPSATGALVGNAAVENAVVALVNADRKKAKCDPVKIDGRLRNAARQHSADMAARRFLNHRGSDGSSPDDRMRAAGYDAPQSENLARGFTSAKDVMRAWERSRNDRRNIVDCDAQAIGVGVAVSADGTPFWTQDFGA
jgi:uncharacterized protein YkwD